MKMAASGRGKAKDGDKQSSLFDACKNGDLEKVKKSLTPENVNSRDVTGRKSTPLHFAAGKPSVRPGNYMCGQTEWWRASVCVYRGDMTWSC